MPVRAAEVIASDEVDAAVAALRASNAKESKSILRRLDYFEQRLLEDCLSGEVIPFPLPPSARPLEVRHQPLENLYCLDLPAFRRLLYTLVRADGRPYVYLLELVDHPTYSKWFPGRKKH